MEPTEKQEQILEDSGSPPINAPLGNQENSPIEHSSSNPISGQADQESLPENELDAKAEEIQVLNDKYLRLAAEFENYKRRSQRDQSDTLRFANEKILKELLPTIDNLERALQCAQEQSTNIDALLQGVQLTHKQFIDTLSKFGVTQISSVGEVFDPAKHQAVANVESDTIPEQHVLEEYQKGYFLHERILRPAMVTVAIPPSAPNP
jgi:molecular chaperone GrpE